MTKSAATYREKYPDSHHDTYSKTVFGFWLYLLSDFMLFATLFATYAVLRNSTFGGPSSHDLLHLPITLFQTLILLCSSFTIGLTGAAAHRRNKSYTIAFASITFLLGAVFLWMECIELSRLIAAGYGWQRSAFLSAFFTLIGTYGLHILFGLLWIAILILPVCFSGVTPVSIKRLTCLRMFWQFLNIIWVFIFTIVYLMGVIVYD
ncbi:MAG: cytochrome c oxidase subunit 3 [Chlamydiota bacterium]